MGFCPHKASRSCTVVGGSWLGPRNHCGTCSGTAGPCNVGGNSADHRFLGIGNCYFKGTCFCICRRCCIGYCINNCSFPNIKGFCPDKATSAPGCCTGQNIGNSCPGTIIGKSGCRNSNTGCTGIQVGVCRNIGWTRGKDWLFVIGNGYRKTSCGSPRRCIGNGISNIGYTYIKCICTNLPISGGGGGRGHGPGKGETCAVVGKRNIRYDYASRTCTSCIVYRNIGLCTNCRILGIGYCYFKTTGCFQSGSIRGFEGVGCFTYWEKGS